MANFFEDNDDLLFLFDYFDLPSIATEQEGGFPDEPERCDYAPRDAADALDNYRRILSITGDVAGNGIAPRASEVDAEGNTLNEDGTVTLHPSIRENLDLLAAADLMGFTLPYRYGGLNCPTTVYSMAVEIVSRADASLMNLFGLQGIGETINAFADDAIKDEYLPRFARGAVTGAMALTEPDAGSDLQAVALRAWQDDDGAWRLSGTKRFITNGCGDVLLTLARSEPDLKDGRGLSLFVAEPGPRLTVRHLEEKLGIHGSPTCEIVYDDAPAKLVGERQMGLIRYVMSLMNGARLGVACQSLGIAEAAFRVARRYAHTRKQFGVSIERLPAVAEMVTDMKVAIEATRALVYTTSMLCDREINNQRVLETAPPSDPPQLKERKLRARNYKRLNALLTPLSKYYASEMCVRVANDALQVLGGSGYMRDYPVERLLRDARITTIYEGTSQMQVVAAVRGVCGGAFEKQLEPYETARDLGDELAGLHAELQAGKEQVLAAIAEVKKRGTTYMDLQGRRLVDAAAAVIIGHILLDQARSDQRKRVVAARFITGSMGTLKRDVDQILSGDTTALDAYDTIAGPPPEFA